MSHETDRAREAAHEWCRAVVMMDDEEEARAEVRQMLIDAMDATEQSDLGMDVCRAFDAFEGKATGPQGPHREAIQNDRDRLTGAVSMFLRQRPNPQEGMRCFPDSAVAKLASALQASYDVGGTDKDD